jgi:hypothetical protein
VGRAEGINADGCVAKEAPGRKEKLGEFTDVDGEEVADAGPQVAQIDAGKVAAMMDAQGEESKDNSDQGKKVRKLFNANDTETAEALNEAAGSTLAEPTRTVGGVRKSINDVLCGGMRSGVGKVALPEKPSKKGPGEECGGTHSQKLSSLYTVTLYSKYTGALTFRICVRGCEARAWSWSNSGARNRQRGYRRNRRGAEGTGRWQSL